MVTLEVTMFIDNNPSRAFLSFKLPDGISSDQQKEAIMHLKDTAIFLHHQRCIHFAAK